ncbi:uncharacterized protein LOC124121873 isoform X2 [Haliotis rufescens]|uniref:uncharacterized protein LOC124121873 isoform X2 n=1 Tax=Haliotis rufescens TaxID=6454 RepID=UPI00201EB641|nr:uncharacterized protein LOC124121873 isoform X2 [Haliotis rufescens]
MFRISPLLLLTLVSFTDHVGSVVLTRSPLTASDGELFTLICSSNTSSGRDRQWYRNDLFVFITTQGSSCPSISKDYVFQPYLAGRVNVSCDVLQHNVTLRIKSDRDNGTRWKCLDNTKSQTSHTVTIHVTELQSKPAATLILSTPVITTTTEDKSLPKSTDVVNLMTASSTATKAATRATTGTLATTITTATTGTSATTAKFDISSSTSLQEGDAPNVAYIAVGAAVGGVVVGCVITAIVFIMWMRRRNTSTGDDASAPNIYTSPAHYEDMEHQYDKVDRQYVNTVEVSGAGSPDSVNTEDQEGNAAYYNTTGQHQHPDEHANARNTTYYNDSRDADN